MKFSHFPGECNTEGVRVEPMATQGVYTE